MQRKRPDRAGCLSDGCSLGNALQKQKNNEQTALMMDIKLMKQGLQRA